jgi:phage repressor protein C with HTH and peptisase S24 domain
MSTRIRQLRTLRKLTLQEVGDAFGINRASVAEWESGRSKPSVEKLPTLARVLGTTVEHLVSGGPTAVVASGAPGSDEYLPVRRVRFVLSAGATGYQIEYDNDDAPPLFFRREWFQKRGYKPEMLCALKVRGASMEPGLYDNDTVVVNLGDVRLLDGEVFAFNYEGECVIKRLKRDSGDWWLTSDNADKRRYPDKRCDERVMVLGRIITKQSERI